MSSSQSSPADSSSSSYWCHRCCRFVRVWNQESIACPDCNSGFIEEIDNFNNSSGSTPDSVRSETRRRRVPPGSMYMVGNRPNSGGPGIRRPRRNGGDRSPFNPVIVLRGPSDGGGGGGGGGERGGFELFYDDGVGSGLRPLPATMSEFLLGSGFDRLLDQLSQIEINGLGRFENPPASKAAIESLPSVQISETHIDGESHCAVCKEPFDLGSEARQMPCQHIYHSDCILPWLALRNSCPVCRHELPSDMPGLAENSTGQSEQLSEEETVGLTIWRLPGGGFAVGRFSGGRRGEEREFPMVYTEMDGGFNSSGAPRRVRWEARGSRSPAVRSRLGRAFQRLFGCFRGSNVASTSSGSRLAHGGTNPVLRFSNTPSQRRNVLEVEVNNNGGRWRN